MHKKIIVLSLAIFVIFSLVFAFPAARKVFADQERESNHQDNQEGDQGDQSGDNQESSFGDVRESVNIKANGDFTVTGATVNSIDVASNSLNASLFGLSKTVNLAGATITGGSTTIAISDFKVGDKLSGSGNYNETTHVITVSRVNDASYVNRRNSDIQTQIDQLLQLVKQLQAQLQALQP